MRDKDLNLLVVLAVLLEEKNVTKAARRLSLTQSTVSGMLARLRDMLDDPLFVRAKHGLRPTPRAEALAEPLHRWLEETERVFEEDDFEPEVAEVTYVLAGSDYALSLFGPALVAHLGQTAPRARLALRTLKPGTFVEQLADGRLDLAITIPEFASEALYTRPLVTDSYLSAVGERHGRSVPRSLAAFLKREHVIVSLGGTGFEGALDAKLAAFGKRRRVVLTVPSFMMLPEVLDARPLIATAPARLLSRFEGRLTLFTPPIERPNMRLVLLWHARTHHDPAQKWLREAIVDVGRTLSPE